MKSPHLYSIVIIREGKLPSDARTPLTPKQTAFLRHELDINICVQSSDVRCFTDDEYASLNVPVVNDIHDFDVLLGVKEVPIELLIPNKTYFFFSHTIKKQDYNKPLLRDILKKRIRLIDYEALTNRHGNRVIAFGHFAGMVGAHNSIWTYGQRTGSFQLPRMYKVIDYDAMKKHYATLNLPAIKIVLTGTGRVGTGALQVLEDMGIQQITPTSFLTNTFQVPVFTQLHPHHYAKHKLGEKFNKNDFYNNPSEYEGIFLPYTKVSDIMINGIYWDSTAPTFFDIQHMLQDDFKIQVIGDITCDIAPNSSVPSTIRPSSISDPVYGFDPKTNQEIDPYSGPVDVMAIDNLPNEMPRDASKSFGKQFITTILGELLSEDKSNLLERATIARNGNLGLYFQYLQDWVDN